MLILAIVIAACVGAHDERLTIASTFRPWALNDSTAFVFPRIAEKRNRVRRERLAAALRRARERKQTEEAPRKPSRTAPAAPGAGKAHC